MNDNMDKKTYSYGTISSSISKPSHTPLDIAGVDRNDNSKDIFNESYFHVLGFRITNTIPAMEGTDAYFVTEDDNIIKLRVICWCVVEIKTEDSICGDDHIEGFCLFPTKPELVSVSGFEKFVCYGYPGENSIIIDNRIKDVLQLFKQNNKGFVEK
jgi:hypothetical protein